MDARANFGYSLVASAPSPADSGTELDVVSADDYPAVPFNATVWPADALPLNSNAEIVRVTAIDGDTLTIEREQEGTTAVAIAAGYQFAATVTAKAFDDIEDDLAALDTAIDGKQPLDAELTALAGLTSAADRVPYFTGSGTATVATFTAAGRALVDDANAAAQRTTLELGTAAVTDATAYATAAQGVDARTPTAHDHDSRYYTESEIDTLLAGLGLPDTELAAIAALVSAADRLPYFTGLGTASLAVFTGAARTLIAAVDAAAQRTALGLGTAALSASGDFQPVDADLTTIAGLTATTDNFMVAVSSAWASRTPAQAKTSLALVKGDVGLGNVDNTSDANKPVSSATQAALDAKQPIDADLTTIAELTATTDNFMVAASSAWASRTPAQARTHMGLGTAALAASGDFATAVHTHDDRYYTEGETDALVAANAGQRWARTFALMGA